MNLIIEQGLKLALKPEIDRLNKDLEKFAKSTDGYLGDLLSYTLINSGKRVRPALVILGSQLGKVNPDQVRTIEMAVELIHIATLVHDDIIDKAALRRGRKTVQNDQGIDTAVLLGDYIFTYAFQKIAELGNPPVLKLLAQSTADMCKGEIGQLKSRYQFDISDHDYFDFIEKKTAALFGASIRSGAILAGQDERIQQACEDFGLHLGIAFQIADDLLDLTGDELIVGKTLRTDLVNGKMTLPLIHYRNQLNSQFDRKGFVDHLKNPNGHLYNLISDIKKAGSVDYAQGIAELHIQRALDQLNVLPNGMARMHLTQLAEMLRNRNA